MRYRKDTIARAHAVVAEAARGWDRLVPEDGPLSRYVLRHGVAHQLKVGRPLDAEANLTRFDWAQARLRALPTQTLSAMALDYEAAAASRAATSPALRSWRDFVRAKVHLWRRGAPAWPAERILLQTACEEPPGSRVRLAAEGWLDEGHCNWTWLRRVELPEVAPGRTGAANEPSAASPEPTAGAERVFDGHSAAVTVALALDPRRLLSCSEDQTVRIWDLASGECLRTIGPLPEVMDRAQLLAGGRVRVFQHDSLAEAHGHYLAMDDDAVLTIDDHVHDSTMFHLEAPLSDGQVLMTDVLGPEPDRLKLVALDGSVRSLASASAPGWFGRVVSKVTGRTAKADASKRATWLGELRPGLVLSGHQDGMVRVWDLARGESSATFKVHGGVVKRAQVLSDGSLLSWGEDGAIQRTSLPDGAVLARLSLGRAEVLGVAPLRGERWLAWSARGARVWAATGEDPGAEVRGWPKEAGDDLDVADLGDAGVLVRGVIGGPVRVDLTASGGPACAALGPRGRDAGAAVVGETAFVAWSKDSGVALHQRTGAPPRPLSGWPAGGPRVSLPAGGTAFGPDHGVLWHGATLYVVSLAEAAVTATLSGHVGKVKGALVTPAGQLVSWAEDGSLRRWGTAARFVASLAPAAGAETEVPGFTAQLFDRWPARAAEWSHAAGNGKLGRGGWFADKAPASFLRRGGMSHRHETSEDGRARLPGGGLVTWSASELIHWRADDGAMARRVPLSGKVTGLSPDRRSLLVIGDRVRVLDVATGRELGAWDTLDRGTRGVWRDDASCFIVGRGEVRLLRVGDAAPVASVRLPDGFVAQHHEGGVVLPCGTICVLSVLEGPPGFWSGEPGAPLRQPAPSRRKDAWRQLLGPLGAGRVALRSDADRSIEVFDLARDPSKPDRLKRVCKLEGHPDAADADGLFGENEVRGVLALTTGAWVSWAKDAGVRVWAPDAGRLLHVLGGHEGEVGGVMEVAPGRVVTWCDRPRGHFVTSKVVDGALRLWDTASGQLLATMPRHRGFVSGCVRLEGGRVLSWSHAGDLALWRGSDGRLIAWRGFGPRAGLKRPTMAALLRRLAVRSWSVGATSAIPYHGWVELSGDVTRRWARWACDGRPEVLALLPSGAVATSQGVLQLWHGDAPVPLTCLGSLREPARPRLAPLIAP